ncbi:MAG TPA: hypothetical protein P5565_08500 [Bacteroidia bacterium]|jgi:hypothetical protein|nr:hypothetical protein [Bacteroidia bacterium]HRS39567.1 hypothetical protein [Bacteroidia bacterium]HRU61499.1 hypothetical protein [Bacteroidia bacterium]
MNIQKTMRKAMILSALLMAGTLVQGQHVVTMKSGEKMSGKVESIQNETLEFLYKGNKMNFPLADLYSINFAEQSSLTAGESTSSAPREVGEKQVTSGSYLVRYKVADRIVAKPPRIDNLTQEKGTVVVDVTIDKYGHVMKAIPGAPGSTTNSEYLKTKAKQAAESALFNNVPTAPLEQKGYMIISF